jgi:hypothetical protein
MKLIRKAVIYFCKISGIANATNSMVKRIMTDRLVLKQTTERISRIFISAPCLLFGQLPSLIRGAIQKMCNSQIVDIVHKPRFTFQTL